MTKGFVDIRPSKLATARFLVDRLASAADVLKLPHAQLEIFLAPPTPIFRGASQAHKLPTFRTLFVVRAIAAMNTVTRFTTGFTLVKAVYTDSAPTFFARRHKECALVCA